MSRSCKKTPCHRDWWDGGDPFYRLWVKRHHNRVLRRTGGLDVPSGNSYRRVWTNADCYYREVGTSYQQFRGEEIACGSYVGEKSCRLQYYMMYRRK